MNKFEGNVSSFSKPEQPPFGPADEARKAVMESIVHEELRKHPEMDEFHMRKVRSAAVAAQPDSSLLEHLRTSTKEQWLQVPDFFAAVLEEIEDRGLAARS